MTVKGSSVMSCCCLINVSLRSELWFRPVDSRIVSDTFHRSRYNQPFFETGCVAVTRLGLIDEWHVVLCKSDL